MSEERQYDHVITTQLELNALVSEALVTGELNLVHYKIDVDFNLVELLLAFEQKKTPYKGRADSSIEFNIECPFEIRVGGFNFDQKFSAYDSKNKIAVIFTKKAIFLLAIFTSWADFSFATFTESADFSFATFRGEADFSFATFRGEANFRRTNFSDVAYFTRTSFSDVADFSHTNFLGETYFNLSFFTGKADFNSATFKKHSSFKGVTILENAILDFDHITTYEYFDIMPKLLNGEIIIYDPTLESDKRSFVVDLGFLFKEYTRKGKVIFKRVEIDNDRMCLKIRNLKEKSNVTVHFENCRFYGKNVAFTNVDMQQVSITGGNYVSGMAFYHCEWAKEPAFFGLKFRAFNGLDTTDVPKIVESYGNLKVSALDAGDAQLSNDFHFWHQWHQWENLYKKGLWNWNNFYRITSAYGMSVRLPLFWFICVIGIFTLFYAPITKVPQPTLMFAFRTSIENSLPLISWTRSSLFNTHPTPYLLLSILQHLIQGYLLFQIGAAIRNKVKR